jgi:hypothetical protein
MTTPIPFLETAGGRIRCLRCRARSKRTGNQCAAPAMTGKFVCKTHGGASTGPRTAAGRARCAAARTVHGLDTRKARQELSEALVELKGLEEVARLIGLISGPRSPGRPPGYRK